MRVNKRWIVRLAGVVAVSLLAVTGIAAAGSIGSEDDPLVTYSYVTETFKDEVLSEANGGFVLAELKKNQVLSGTVGTEVMLRVGTAECVADSAPGLIDTTDAVTLNHGKTLQKNHVYMMTIEDRGVKATADTVKVLVRGSYSVE